jgi:hypothetical protein
VDAGPPDTGPRDSGPEPDAGPPLPEWPHDLAPTTELPTVRGLSVARSIIHLHSPLSHDACDGKGWVDGALADPECLAHLRDAVCRLHLDVANLTDHSSHINEVAFPDALWIDSAAGDEPLMEGGAVVAARWACADGHRVIITAGSENDLMPIALERHPIDSTDPVMLEAAYDADGPDAVASFRAAGGLVFIPHTEQRPLDYLRTIGVDGIEIFNIHAAVDPRIRSEHLGLPGSDHLVDLLAFTDRRNRLEPDLAFVSFFLENRNHLDKWDALLAEGIDVSGVIGTDAHENTFTALMPDGERGDSYRRLMRWFTNHVLVADRTREAYLEGLAARRTAVVVEGWGTPVGFDYVATATDGTMPIEMGGTAPLGHELTVTLPTLAADYPAEPPPEIRARILRSTATGGMVVAEGATPELTFTPTEAGAYRAEIRITPHHTTPYLRHFEREATDQIWIYANAIRIE